MIEKRMGVKLDIDEVFLFVDVFIVYFVNSLLVVCKDVRQ